MAAIFILPLITVWLQFRVLPGPSMSSSVYGLRARCFSEPTTVSVALRCVGLELIGSLPRQRAHPAGISAAA
jgi:hypothetical protein